MNLYANHWYKITYFYKGTLRKKTDYFYRNQTFEAANFVLNQHQDQTICLAAQSGVLGLS